MIPDCLQQRSDKLRGDGDRRSCMIPDSAAVWQTKLSNGNRGLGTISPILAAPGPLNMQRWGLGRTPTGDAGREQLRHRLRRRPNAAEWGLTPAFTVIGSIIPYGDARSPVILANRRRCCFGKRAGCRRLCKERPEATGPIGPRTLIRFESDDSY